jgi:23S rRNA pseudouridine2605 synthase
MPERGSRLPADAGPPSGPIRIQKYLAHLGVGSRREIEAWIRAGRLTREGVVLALGARIEPGDPLCLDGRPLATPPHPDIPLRILLYHKPAGELTTRKDPVGRPTVFEHLPRLRQGRWIAVGRLDYQSEGLLLFTTHGDLARRLMHPSGGWIREYRVRVRGRLATVSESDLRRGVDLEDGRASFDELEALGGEGVNHWYRVVVQEGRNRLVRRLFESRGHRVNRLIRVRYGPFVLPRNLRAGGVRELGPDELRGLDLRLFSNGRVPNPR